MINECPRVTSQIGGRNPAAFARSRETHEAVSCFGVGMADGVTCALDFFAGLSS
jgi:hypothetical protein